VHSHPHHTARHRVIEVLLQSLLCLLVPLAHLSLLLADLLLSHGLTNDLRAVSQELWQALKKLFLFFRRECLLVLERQRVMVLRPSQVDIARADFHAIKEAESALSAGIVRILAEAVAFRVLLSCLLHQMEALQTAIPLQQILYLILRVLLR